MSFPGDAILINSEFFCLAQKKYCSHFCIKEHNYKVNTVFCKAQIIFFFILYLDYNKNLQFSNSSSRIYYLKI